MLVLTRKSEEAVRIGEGITVTVLEIRGNQVRIGIDAPAEVRIYRKEVFEKIMSENIESAGLSTDDFARIREKVRR